MMTLLGQHGQPQDYRRGVELIKLSAETADENAPQGAYVRHSVRTSRANTDSHWRSMACSRLESFPKSLFLTTSYL